MADTTLTAVPSAVYAGDTLSLLISLSDYSAADGWVLSYAFRKTGGSEIEFSSTASGSNHLLSIPATTTAEWLTGLYLGTGKVSYNGAVHTIWRGQMEVLPDLAEEAESFETRTHARICLDAINAVLQRKATRDIQQTTIAGQSIGRMTWTELQQAKSFYQDIVDSEQAAIDAANGKGNSRNILVRFNRP